MNPRNETYRLSLTEADRVFAQQIESLSDLQLETRKLHARAIRGFLNSATKPGYRDCRSAIIDESQIVRWVVRTPSELAPSYTAKHYQAVDRYCDALVEAGLLPLNPMAAFKVHHGNQSWERIAQSAQSIDPEGALANLRVEPLPPGPLEEHLQAYVRLNRAVG